MKKVDSGVPDGGFGWVVCGAGFVVQFIVLGIHNSFGILFTYLMRDLNSPASDTAWVGSMAFGMNFLCGPLVSGLALRYGCRIVGCVGGIISVIGLLLTSFSNSIYVIYVTYSVIWGLGSSLTYGPTMMVLGLYFRRHLSTANGIVTAGSGLGTLAIGPLYHVLLTTFGWRVLLRVMSAVTFLMFISSLFYRPVRILEKEIAVEGKTKHKFIDFSVWKDKVFISWVISMSLLFAGYFVPFIHLPNHAINLGISPQLASLLIGYLSIASTVSRVLFGIFLNHPKVNRFYILQICFLMMAVTTTLCPLALTYEGLILYVVLFGAFDGCFVLLIAVSTADIVGPHKLVHALGNLYGIIAIPMIFGPPLAGFIFQISGSYENAFFLAGGAMAIGTCTLSFIPMCMKPSEPEEILVSGGPSQISKTSSTEVISDKKVDSDTGQLVVVHRAHSQQSLIRYNTQRFSQSGSTWTISDYAIGRLGDVFGFEAIIESMDRESFV